MMKCVECGTELDDSVKVCPNCGCPVQSVPVVEKENGAPVNVLVANTKPAPKKFKINLMAVISLILGIVVLVVGFKVTDKKFEINEYNASRYSVDSAKFGADFYTEIYKASDVAVDAISAVNGGIASLSTSVADFAEVVTYSAGMIIVAIGMGVIAVSVLHIKKED